MVFAQEVSPKGAAAAPGSNEAAPGAGGLGPMVTFLPLIAVMVVMFFLSSRRQKKEAQARQALRKGQKVLLQSGIVGELAEMEDRFAKVKIAPGTTIQVLATTVSPLEAQTAAASTDDKDKALADLKEAKASAGGDKK